MLEQCRILPGFGSLEQGLLQIYSDEHGVVLLLSRLVSPFGLPQCDQDMSLQSEINS